MHGQTSPKLMNFSEINPYEMMYRNMNINVNQTISKEHAEIVARQLGYMHNAFGVIVKDFIKILSFKFMDAGQKEIDRRNFVGYAAGNGKMMADPDAMDIEEPSASPKHTKPKQKQPERERQLPQIVERREPVLQPKPNKQQQKPPNIDLFGEFAFENDAYEVVKKPNKESKEAKEPIHLQEKVNKINEGVKKKKDGRKLDNQLAEEDYESHSKDRMEQPNNRLMNREPEESKPTKPQIPINNEPKASLFDDFEYDRPIPTNPAPLQPLMREKSDSLWQLANIPPKQKPPIYEISDDEN